MTRIAILGLGAMGRRMARRLVNAGYSLTLWSRSGLPAELATVQAAFAATPREAAEHADVIISMITDDEASRTVWTTEGAGALWGLKAGAIAIESSTLTPAWVSSLSRQVEATGAAFLDAPVVGSRPQAEAGVLVHLVGGAADTLARARPVLSVLGSAIHHVGLSPAGTVAKLAVNALFGVQVALLGELVEFAQHGGIKPSKLLEVMEALPVMSPAAKAALQSISIDQYEPMFPISLVEKDFRYAVTTATALGTKVPITRHACELFQLAAANGLGELHITAIAMLYQGSG